MSTVKAVSGRVLTGTGIVMLAGASVIAARGSLAAFLVGVTFGFVTALVTLTVKRRA